MLGSVVLALAMSQVDAAPRLKATFHNGVQAHVERVPEARGFALTISSSFAEPTDPALHGARHMVEHLVAKRADQIVELQGMALIARTTRDSVSFSIAGQTEDFATAVRALGAILTPLQATPADIEREASLIAEEIALLPFEAELAKAAWTAAFGESGQDPYGDPTALAKLRPDQLEEVRGAMFRGPSVSVSVVGRIDLDGAMARMRDATVTLPQDDADSPLDRALPKVTSLHISNKLGSSRSVAVGGLDSARALASLAAGFGLHKRIPGSRLLYTPTLAPGLITLAHKDSTVLMRIETMTSTDLELMAESGRDQLLAWLDGQFRSPLSRSRFRSEFTGQRVGSDIDEVLRRAAALSRAEIVQAAAAFHARSAVAGEGQK